MKEAEAMSEEKLAGFCTQGARNVVMIGRVGARLTWGEFLQACNSGAELCVEFPRSKPL